MAAGCASSSSTTRRTAGSPAPSSRRGSACFSHARLERLQDLLLALLPEPREVAQPPVLGRGLQALERGDSELGPDPGGRLRADAGQPQEVDHAHGDALASPRERVHLPVVDDLDDLLLDRLPDSGQLGRATRERELGDRRRRLPDTRRRAPVGDDLERLLREDLRDVREQVELVGDLRVPGQRLGHAAMIRTMPRAVVCLPTYNERENLEAMVRALGEVLDTSRDGVLVIDDGSPDGTGEIADRLADGAALGLGAASRTRRRESGRRTSQASGTCSRATPSSCSRWTATSRTTRATCRG